MPCVLQAAGRRQHVLFFSNRLGCVGSVVVSLILSLVLVLAMRSCSTVAW